MKSQPDIHYSSNINKEYVDAPNGNQPLLQGDSLETIDYLDFDAFEETNNDLLDEIFKNGIIIY